MPRDYVDELNVIQKTSVRRRIADAGASISIWLVAIGLVSVILGVILSIRWTGKITCDGFEMSVIDLLAGGWWLFPAALLTAIVSLVLGARRKGRAIAMIPTSLVLGFLTVVVLAGGGTGCY